MDFTPDQTKHEPQQVPFFEDVTSEGGWQGHSTGKSMDTLKAEVMSAIGRLGGLVTGFQPGTYVIGAQKRDGFRVRYVIEHPSGATPRGQLDIAALPVKDEQRTRRSHERWRERSLKMALYMLRQALDGTWFLQQLSPGYAPLMPWMIHESGKTITQMWSESAAMSNLLPPPDADFVDTDVTVLTAEDD